MKQSYRKFFIVMVLLVLINALISLVMPVLVNYWSIQKVMIGTKEVIILLVVMFAGLGLKIGLSILREVFALDFNKNNCRNYLEKYMDLNYGYISEKGPMNLLQRLGQSVSSIYLFLTGPAVFIYSNLVIVAAVLLISFFVNRIVFAILFLLIPFNYFAFKMLNAELFKRSKVLHEAKSKGWSNVYSVMTNTDYIKQSNNHKEILKKLEPNIDYIYSAIKNINIFAQASSAFISSISEIAQIFVLLLVVKNSFESGNYLDTLTIGVLIPLYKSSLSEITDSNLGKQDYIVAQEFFQEWQEYYEATDGQSLENIESIEFDLEELGLGEKKIPFILKRTFNLGDIVWVKGESGSGKSTLLKLLPRFRDESTLYINGKDIREIDLGNLRGKVEYMSQNVAMINGSLRDNLFLDIPYNFQIEEAMIADPLLASILKTKTLDSEITENGSNISGGEKQKIAMVRTLHKKPQVLILDEVCSSIDQESTNDIYRRLTQEVEDKILFIIDHHHPLDEFVNEIIAF